MVKVKSPRAQRVLAGVSRLERRLLAVVRPPLAHRRGPGQLPHFGFRVPAVQKLQIVAGQRLVHAHLFDGAARVEGEERRSSCRRREGVGRIHFEARVGDDGLERPRRVHARERQPASLRRCLHDLELRFVPRHGREKVPVFPRIDSSTPLFTSRYSSSTLSAAGWSASRRLKNAARVSPSCHRRPRSSSPATPSARRAPC